MPETHSQKTGHLLRIYLGESDRFEGMPLYEWLVRKAKEVGLSGATVLRGIEGYGAHSNIHTSRLLDLSTDLPIIVEVIDVLEKIETFMPVVEEVLKEGLVTLEEIHIRLHRSGKKNIV